MLKKKIFYGWYIVAACFLLSCLFAGAGFYSFSIFINPIENEFGWGRGAISLTMSIYLITAGLMGPVIGKLIQRFGPKKVMNTCAIGAGACFLLVSFTHSLVYLYSVYAMLAIMVCGIGIIPVSTLLSNWFEKRRGTAIGISLVGISAGGFLLAPLVGVVTANFGWQTSFVVIGVLVWIIALPTINFIIRDKPEDIGEMPDGESERMPAETDGKRPLPLSSTGWPAREVFHSRSFWFIFIAFFLTPLAQMGVLQHQVPLIVETGTSQAMAAAALGVTAGIGGLGKLGFGRISEIWPFRYAILLCFGFQAIAVLILLHTTTSVMVWIFALLFGFSMGGVVVLLPLVVGHYWGLLSYGVLLGTLWIANSLGGALGTYTSGWIYDHMGDYRYALYLYIGAYLVSIIAFFLADKPQPFRHSPYDQSPDSKST